MRQVFNAIQIVGTKNCNRPCKGLRFLPISRKLLGDIFAIEKTDPACSALYDRVCLF